MIITELSTLTKPQRYDAVMAGNIKVSTEILREVVEYNRKFSASLETEVANIEVSAPYKIIYYYCILWCREMYNQNTLEMISIEQGEKTQKRWPNTNGIAWAKGKGASEDIKITSCNWILDWT